MSDWKASRRKQLEAKLIAFAGYRALALLGLTLRWRMDGFERFDAVRAQGRQPIIACWHGRILSGIFCFKRRGVVALASRNFDGEWISGILERFGYDVVRGSSSRGASRALLQLTREIGGGKAVAFTVDGPRGPARVAQPGALWLAKATGNPVLPFHLEANRFWTLGSWDRTQIPKPFSTVALVVGEPFDVPSDAGDEGIERARLSLEERLRALETRARELLC